MYEYELSCNCEFLDQVGVDIGAVNHFKVVSWLTTKIWYTWLG